MSYSSAQTVKKAGKGQNSHSGKNTVFQNTSKLQMHAIKFSQQQIFCFLNLPRTNEGSHLVYCITCSGFVAESATCVDVKQLAM